MDRDSYDKAIETLDDAIEAVAQEIGQQSLRTGGGGVPMLQLAQQVVTFAEARSVLLSALERRASQP